MSRRATLAAVGHICAALFLTGFVVGVPMALHAFGWPLPARWPSWSGFVTDVKLGYVPSSVLLKIALGAGWAVWAFVTYEIVAEASSWIRHRAARRASFLGPFQPLFSKLVAAAVLSAPLPGRGLLMTAPPAPFPSAVALVGATTAAGSPISQATAPLTLVSHPSAPQLQPSAVGLPTYLVRPHDTLWGIAERYLGDPLRWSEIAALNEGRAEGSSQFSDPHWIYPGWVLALPADATGLPAPPATQPAAPVPAASPTSTPATTAPPSSPSSSTSPPTSTERHGASDNGEGRMTVSTPSAGHHRKGLPAPVVPIGAGLLGVGVGFALATGRKAQQRHRRPGRRIPLPTGALAQVETALAVGSDRDTAVWVNRTARLLAWRLFGTRSVPEVLAIVVRDQVVELMVDVGESTASPPAPFVAAGAGRWHLPRSAEVEDLDPETFGYPSALPGLVTVGRSEDGVVLLNLEAGGLVSITGKGRGPKDLASAMAVELATCTWTDVVSLYVTGLDEEARRGLETLERPRCFASLVATLNHVQCHVDENRAQLERTGEQSAVEVRMRELDLDFSPLVLICGDAPAPEEQAVLARWTDASRLALAVVVAGELEGAQWNLVLSDDGTLLIDPLGLAIRPQRLSRDEARGVGELLLLVARRDDVSADEPPYDAMAEPLAPAFQVLEAPAARVGEDLDHDQFAEELQAAPRLVFLGPVHLEGILQEPPRPKALELLSWLVLHPGGADQDRVATVMWPGAFPSQGNVRVLVSRTRHWLGKCPDGRWYLPPHGALCLEPPLRNDWAELQALARSSDPADWRRALELVRGRPFEGVDWPWATTEGFQASMEAEIVDLADRAARLQLGQGRLNEARWSAERGLVASPYEERLYRALMEVAARSSGTTAVRAVMRRLAAVLESDVEPTDVVSAETTELFTRLTAPPPPGGRKGPSTNGHGPAPGPDEPGRSGL